MSEQLRLIEAGLYKSEITFPPLKERLLQSGELRAWYKYYRGGNQWAGKFFFEENVFLMSKVLIWNQIAEDGTMSIHSFVLDDIEKITRNYLFEDKSMQKLVLTEAIITLKTMKDKNKRDILVCKRPQQAEQGDVEGFEKLMALLD